MYVKTIELENIKSFKKFTWKLDGEDPAGWHVLLGKNGSGKSTFIRSAAAALIGPLEAQKSRATFSDWIKKGASKGSISMEIVQDEKYDSWSGKGRPQSSNIEFTIELLRDNTLKHSAATAKQSAVDRTLWSGKKGWFSASYGPFRRFSGGNRDYQKLFYSSPLLARHLSVFGEDVALTETLEWLKDLKFKTLENKHSESARLLDHIMAFINQDDFLPNNVTMESVSSEGILFSDAYGAEVNIEDLSDGYRSVLSMMLELIRQMHHCYETSDIFDKRCERIIYPGVVFIDEVDVHLHPAWQRKIGSWMTRHFPRVQFIVSTHSALICQSALNGSVWKLPGADPEDDGKRIVGTPLNRLLYGNLLEAFSSGAFGHGVERSDEARQLLKEFAELNYHSMEGDLTDVQEKRREYLSTIFALELSATR